VIPVRECKEALQRIQDANGISDRQARGVFRTYLNIRGCGIEWAKNHRSRSTWYRHLKYFRAAGIDVADLQPGNIVLFPPGRVIVARPVTCWEDIGKAS
jgi:II/X family phage/plasmid replication protein